MQAKTTYSHEADYRRERDFGAKVGATFDFVAAQFRPLLKCLAYFVLPGALLAGIGLGLVLSNFLTKIPLTGSSGRVGGPVDIAQQHGNSPLSALSAAGLGLSALGLLLAFLLLSSTVYGFVRVRMNTPPAEPVEPARVWAFMWPRLGRVVGGWMLLGIVVFVGMGVVGGTLALVGPGFVVLLFFPLMWAAVCLTLYFPVLWMEDGGVAKAFQRSFYLMRGKWWSSLGLYLVMSMIAGTINYVFLIPFYGLMMVRTVLKIPGFDSEILSVAAMCLSALGWILTAMLPLVAMLFQYFNLVERRDGTGLRLLVDSLGRTPAPQVSSATYQPDDEGEY